MTTRDGLMAAILDRPFDDTPRLVLADWLDDHDEPERAAFIRVQVELSRMRRPPQWLDRDAPVGMFGDQERRFHKWGKNSPWGKRKAAMEQRARELFDASAAAWFDIAAICRTWPRVNVTTGAWRFPPESELAVVSRGFVSEVRLSLAAFVGGPARTDYPAGRVPGLARELFAAHPITRVVLTDREPDEYQQSHLPWSWRRGEIPGQYAYDVPAAIWDMLVGSKPGGERTRDGNGWLCNYSTRDDALTALSHALVAYGRALVGLRPLTDPTPATLPQQPGGAAATTSPTTH